MLDFVTIHCPACGEPQTLTVDTSGGAQHYVEDCQICCRPMEVVVNVDDDDTARVHVSGDSD